MTRGAAIALSVLGALGVFLTAAFLIALSWFDPTLGGLRPHAVFGNLKTYSLPELVALSDDPVVDAVLIRDEYHEKQGASGWFALTGAQLQNEELRFGFAGALDYNPTIFVSGPKSCGVGQPRKAIIALEPSRAKGGFVGRSTCTRPKMDLREVIEQATPVERHVWSDVPQSKYLELRRQVLAKPNSGVLLGPINRKLDAAPFERRVLLPVVQESPAWPIYKIRNAISEQIAALVMPEGVTATAGYVQLTYSDQDGAEKVFLKSGEDALAITGGRMFQPYASFRCSQAAKAFCNEVTADWVTPELNKRSLTAADIDRLLGTAVLIEGAAQANYLTPEALRRSAAYVAPLTETRVSFAFYKLMAP